MKSGEQESLAPGKYTSIGLLIPNGSLENIQTSIIQTEQRVFMS